MNARLRAGALVAALCTAAPLLVAGPASAASSPTSIAYVVDKDGDGYGALVVRDLTARTSRTVVPEGDVYVEAPQISPDGTRIAFATDVDSPDGDLGIAVVPVGGGAIRRLTDPPAATEHVVTSDTDPSWVDNGVIVFGRTAEDDRGASLRGTINRVAVTGGPVTQVPGTGNGMSPDVSPFGTRVAYVALAPSNTGAGAVVVQDLAVPTAEPRGIGAYGYDPAWSPDGRRVAWARYGQDVPDGIAHVAVDGDGNSPVVVVPYSGTVATFAPFWLSDGRSLVYSRFALEGDTATVDLWAVDADGQRNGPFAATSADELYGSAAARALDLTTGGPASTFVPVEPVRILDTRPESATGTATVGRVGPGGTVRVQVAGRSTAEGTVPSDVTAVVLNVTATAATAGTDVRAYPSGAAVPEVSSLNLAAGQTVPNLVTVAVGRDGAVVLRNSAGAVHLVADLAGWYVPGSTAAAFTPLEPRRVLDTRSGLGSTAGPGRVGAGESVALHLRGDVPSPDGPLSIPDTATAVILNVTATGATRSTDVRVYPSGTGAVPEVSNLNLTAGQTVANQVVVRLGQQGDVRLRNATGGTFLIADVAGWFGPGGEAQFVPASPVRMLDTRDGTGAAPIATGAGRAVDVRVAGARGVPAEAVAAALNLTVTGATASTDVRAYPTTASRVPTVSNVNVARGVTRANAAVVKTGTDGEVRLRNGAGAVQLIADLAGWFVPAA